MNAPKKINFNSDEGIFENFEINPTLYLNS